MRQLGDQCGNVLVLREVGAQRDAFTRPLAVELLRGGGEITAGGDVDPRATGNEARCDAAADASAATGHAHHLACNSKNVFEVHNPDSF